MRNIPRLLLVLHTEPLLRERLRVVARERAFTLDFVADWGALLNEIPAAPASALVVVDPYAGTEHQRGLSTELAALLNRFPSATVVAAMAVARGRLEDVRQLGEWGVVQILDLEEDVTAVEIGFRLSEARGRPLRALVQSALPPQTSGMARSILAAAVQTVSGGGTGADLAKALHVTTRTLLRWCRRAGLPPPRQLLAWMRILLAAELLDDPGRTVLGVALSCGYAADSSLRIALRSFVDASPTELREAGAFQQVGERFVAALAEARSERARYRIASRVKAQSLGT